MSVTLEKTQMISLFYRPKPDDPNRGSCEWARFYFDLKNYVLSIESDCGNYSYGWYPTPNTESFLKLCSRFDEDYLLCKISEESVVDSEATWELIKELINEIVECRCLDEIPLDDMEDIENACHCRSPQEAYKSICFVMEGTVLENKVESYDIWDRICCTYPINAKKIAEVFVQEIKPYIREKLLENEDLFL
jgi:hypothetical protein